MLGDRKDEWLAARLEDLDYGYIDGIAAAVREYPLEGVKKDETEQELGYFLNNAPRMRYHWFRSRGLFVGSGVVEAGCKAVIGQRLKQSGMHWTVNGADSSSPCAAPRPAASGKPPATTVTTRQEPPDKPHPKMILLLQIDAHHRLTPVLLWVPAEPVADPATGVLHNKLGLSAAEEPNW